MASLLDIAKRMVQPYWQQQATAPIKQAINPILQKIGNYDLNRRAPGVQSLSGAFNLVKQNPITFTPLSMREKVVPMTSNVFNAIKRPQMGQDIGYGLRGALSLTPFQRPGARLQSSAPTTQRQRTAQNIGQAVMGTALTAPLGGPSMARNVLGRIPQGAALGAGMTTAGSLISNRRLPTKQELGQGTLQGVQNSWQLAITNTLTDKVLRGIAPQLSRAGIDQTFKNKQLQLGIKKLFLRALAEVPAENTLFSAMDKLNDREKGTFLQIWARELPGNVVGNLAFAGLESGVRSTPYVKQAVSDAMGRAWTKYQASPYSSQVGAVKPDEFLPKPRGVSEMKTKPETPLAEVAPWDKPITKAGMMADTAEEVPFVGAVKKKQIPEIDEQTIKENTTKAVMAEDEPGLVRNLISKWVGLKNAGRTRGAEVASKYTSIPKEKGMDFINQVEGVKDSGDPELKIKAEEWKQDTDNLYKEIKTLGKEVGVDVGYVERYATHYWEESPSKIDKVMSASKYNKSFNERGFPTYTEGISAGLTPKYTNPAQIMSEYVGKLEQTKANLELFKMLQENGLVVSAAEGRGTPGFEPINALGFPKNISKVQGKIIEGNYYAPSTVARTINQVFSPQQASFLNKPAKVAGQAQNILLSGGIPGEPINAFSLGQIVKEVTSGRIKGPLKAMQVSLSPEAATKYQLENVGIIKEMQLNDYPITTRLNTDNLMGNDFSDAGKAWNSVVTDATFKQFMPALEVEFYKDIKKQAIKSGASNEDAIETAIKALRNFSGRGTSSGRLMESPGKRDVLGTFAFAPAYRESMINFWWNNVKALGNPLALENRANIKFLAGTALTIGAFDYLNRMFTGHGLADNPQGKEDKLLIPMGEKTIGIPILPSVGTIPRAVYRQGKAIAQGDVSVALKDMVRSYGSFLAKPFGELAMNEDYFGNEIINPNATTGEKFKQFGSYALKNTLLIHPYLREAWDKYAMKEDRPLYQSISQGLELPFRFYKTESIKNAPFWENYNKAKTADERLTELRYQDPAKAVEYYNQNKSTIDSLKVMREQVSAYYDSGKNSQFLQQGGVINDDQHYAFTGSDGAFHLIDRDFTVEEPKFTGNALLDKKIKSSYSSTITAKQKDVLTLFENGVITGDEAEKILKSLEDARALSSGGGTKKAKKIAIKKITPTKIKLTKAKKFTMKKLPKPKITKTKSGYKILVYKDISPKSKIVKPTIKWS